jgi:hypothetical protein
MKINFYAILLFFACACASNVPQVQPVNIMEEWVGKPIAKLKREWSPKKFKEEKWTNRGKIYTSEERAAFPKTFPSKAKDGITNIEYTSPVANDTAHFLVLTRFYVDSKDIIRKWEITHCSFEPKTK